MSDETDSTGEGEAPLQRTPLYERHVAAGGRMVPFAGYEMPVQYAGGIVAEHRFTREKAGLFDVSHMGQALLLGPDHETTAQALEALVPGDIAGLAAGGMRYTLLLDETGGILDDLMVTRPRDPGQDGTLLVVVNAARKEADFAHIEARLPEGVTLRPAPSMALLALQGPAAAEVAAPLAAGLTDLGFMRSGEFSLDGLGQAIVTRSGYTGEDGFEIALPAEASGALWDRLAADERVMPVGLGARDSLRLEAGLCLYGHDIDETTSPVEANLAWAVPRRRREAGDFPGAERILRELKEGPARRRVGILPQGRAIPREGAVIRVGGEEVGRVTSGGFGPSAGTPVAMGYVAAEHAADGTELEILVRDRPQPARVAPLPFAPHRYHRPA